MWGTFPKNKRSQGQQKDNCFQEKEILFKLLHLFPLKNTGGSILGIVGDNMNMTK